MISPLDPLFIELLSSFEIGVISTAVPVKKASSALSSSS